MIERVLEADWEAWRDVRLEASSEPFSTSVFRVILSIFMVRSLGCVLVFRNPSQPRFGP